jgi:hypothetical protein
MMQLIVVPLVQFDFVAMRPQQSDLSVYNRIFSPKVLVRVMCEKNFHKRGGISIETDQAMRTHPGMTVSVGVPHWQTGFYCTEFIYDMLRQSEREHEQRYCEF